MCLEAKHHFYSDMQFFVRMHLLSNSHWILHILQVGWIHLCPSSSRLSEASFVSALIYSSASVPQSRFSALFCSMTGHVNQRAEQYVRRYYK